MKMKIIENPSVCLMDVLAYCNNTKSGDRKFLVNVPGMRIVVDCSDDDE